MPKPSLPGRVAILEEKVDSLAELPARVAGLESQILQLRAEMHAEIHAMGETLRGEIRAGDEETRRYMLVLHEDLVARISVIGEGQPPRRKRR